MSTTENNFGPVAGKSRIEALDITRGIALLGILLMNITGFGLSWMAYEDPTVQGGSEGPNLFVWVMNFMLFEGTMRGMFSMLFGVGMVLLTTRMESRGAGLMTAEIYYRRLLWLLLFGVIHAYILLWPGEILYGYALFGMMLFPIRKWPVKWLIIAAAVLTLVGTALNTYKYSGKMDKKAKYELAQNYSEADMPEDVKKGKEAWEGIIAEMKPSDEKIQEEKASMHGNYIELLLFLAPYNRYMQTEFIYDVYTWDVLVMMLLGMALFRMRIITAEHSYRYYALMMIAGYAIGFSINYYELRTILDADFAADAFMTAGLSYPYGRIAVTIGHIGLIMLFCKSGILGFLRHSLASVGRMALTNYIMHSVICAFVFYGIGFSLFGQLERYELYYVVFSIWLFQMIASPLWLKYYRFGPLEWLWRSLTYNKKQPLKRT